MTAEAMKELEVEREKLSRGAKGLFATIDRILKILASTEGDEKKQLTDR